MGVKMLKAKVEGESTQIDLYHKDVKSLNLQCIYCQVPVKHTSGFYRNKDDEFRRVYIHPYFSLKPLKNKVPNKHKNGCTYQPKVLIEKVYREAQKLDTTEILKSGQKVFRLHMLSGEINRISSIATEEKDLNKGQKSIRQIINSGQIPPYLKTAKNFAFLWKLLEDNDRYLIRNEIQLIWDKEVIRWSDFVFDPRNKPNHINLVDNYQLRAFIVQPIKTHIEIESDKANHKYEIQCSAFKTNEGGVVVPRVRFNEQTLKEDHTYVIIAKGRIRNNSNKKGTLFHNLTIYLNHSCQIHDLYK